METEDQPLDPEVMSAVTFMSVIRHPDLFSPEARHHAIGYLTTMGIPVMAVAKLPQEYFHQLVEEITLYGGDGGVG